MLWNRKYKYPTSRREIIDGKRHYEINNEKYLLAQKFLNATMPIEKEKLNRTVEKVGKRKPNNLRAFTEEPNYINI